MRPAGPTSSPRLTAIDQPEKDYGHALQQFINQSNREDSLVQENMRRRIGRSFGTEGVLIIDDTGFVTQGKHSVGGARQSSGTLGKVGNCQIAVTLQSQVEKSVPCIGAELYLPKAKVLIERWRRAYNNVRPHSSLG